MLLLFETPAGYSLFQLNDTKKLAQTDAADIHDTFFRDAKKASKSVSLVNFQAFRDTADAVAAASAVTEGRVHESLISFLKKNKKVTKTAELAVADKTLAGPLKNAVSAVPSVRYDDVTHEVFRGVRCHLESLLQQQDDDDDNNTTSIDLNAMRLGLSHSLSRYKLKFSADKVDTMVIQAVGLLDELDKEINTYAMRVKEWYGWTFPELQKLVPDNVKYSQLVLKCGMRENYKNHDLSELLDDQDVEQAVKEAAEISMGTEIAELDILNIAALAEQVISMTEYRTQLFEYLKNRMNAIAPNLTVLVGELVGARLISHAGSLMNLAKQPASTVQILGAEKALFRALKTKHDTPKYGLIYHASLIGQAAPKNKGKISRVLAAKAALAIRVDALSDETVDTTIGFDGRAKVEARLRQLEGGSVMTSSLSTPVTAKYNAVAAKAAANGSAYNTASDMVLDNSSPAVDDDSPTKKKKKKSKKRSLEDHDNGEKEPKSAKKSKKEKKAKKDKRKKE